MRLGGAGVNGEYRGRGRVRGCIIRIAVAEYLRRRPKPVERGSDSMAWEKSGTEENLTGSDGRPWEIGLFTGKTRIVTPPVGKVQHGVKASAFRDDEFQFAIVAWVRSPGIDAAKTAVMKAARRGITEGNWSPGEHELR